MKAEGLVEGSGVPGKDLSSYNKNELWDLIQVTHCFPELQAKKSAVPPKPPNRRKSLIAWLLLAIGLAGGLILYYKQYPSLETRREISVNGIFMD